MSDLKRLKKQQIFEFISHVQKLHRDRSILLTKVCTAANAKETCPGQMNAALTNMYCVLTMS